MIIPTPGIYRAANGALLEVTSIDNYNDNITIMWRFVKPLGELSHIHPMTLSVWAGEGCVRVEEVMS